MKVGIIGAGVSGMALAWYLKKKDPTIEIEILEKSNQPGGLGGWVEFAGIEIEPFYHHFFESDKELIKLIKDLGIGNKLFLAPSSNANFYSDGYHSLTSPIDVLRFGKISFSDKIRLVACLLLLKILPDGTAFDNYTAHEWLRKILGKRCYEVVWSPLMKGKFDQIYKKISMAWFWGRVHDRTLRLGYLNGSNKVFFERLKRALIKNGVKFCFDVSVKKIKERESRLSVFMGAEKLIFDKVVFTGTTNWLPGLAPQIRENEKYLKKTEKIKHIGTVCLLIELDRKLQNFYWVNLCQDDNFLICVEQTNFVERLRKKGKNLVYLAKYTNKESDFYKKTDKELWGMAVETMRKLNPSFKAGWKKSFRVFKAPITQTVFPEGYGEIRPSFRTPVGGLYLLNIDQTFPHDRNLGVAVKLAKELVEKEF